MVLIKYYAKCLTPDGKITLAITAPTEQMAKENLHETYNITEVLDIKSSDEHNFISQREQFQSVPVTYRKDKKMVGSGNFN